jgi:hypothetical protein
MSPATDARQLRVVRRFCLIVAQTHGADCPFAATGDVSRSPGFYNLFFLDLVGRPVLYTGLSATHLLVSFLPEVCLPVAGRPVILGSDRARRRRPARTKSPGASQARSRLAA